MLCPRCETTSLAELDRDGVTIDRCDRCRGVWLDRGELEKLIARSRAADDDRDRPRDDRDRDRPQRRDDDDDDDDDDRRRGKRRGSWWDIFD